MYKNILLKANLTPSQAEILEFLYLNKEAKASIIAKKIKRSRAIVYKELEELEKLKLTEKYDKANHVSMFRATHPSNLETLIKQQEVALEKDKKIIHDNLPNLVSAFNLQHNKPGITFYEGVLGINKVLDDTLKSTTTILAYSDIEAIEKYIPEINKKYVAKRKKRNVKKRGIIIDTPFSRNFLKDYHSDITENRFISRITFPFGSLLQIYNNKIAYITISEKNMIGIIIEDKNISNMHKSLFEFTWKHAKIEISR